MTATSWSGPRPYVSRTAVHAALSRELDAMMESGGRAVFLLGPAGSGQTTLLAVFQEQAFRSHRGLKAEYVDCAHSGAKTWVELAEIFTRLHRLRRSLGVVAADWLESIPVIGKVGQAVVRSVQTIRGGRLAGARSEALSASAHDSAIAAVRLLMEYGPHEPRLIIMDSLDRGDSEDLAGASALIRQLTDTRTLFLAALRTTDGRPPQAIADLILEAERLGRATRLELPALTPEEMRQLVEEATARPAPDAWIDWLAASSRGLPGSLWAALGRLEQDGVLRRGGRRWSWAGSPDGYQGGASERTVDVTGLDREDLRLLELAAAEGAVFHSNVIAELAGVAELDLEDRLSRLSRTRLLQYCGEVGDGADVVSRYEFRNPSDADVFAAGCPERAELSARIQKIKERLGLPDAAR